MAIGIASAIVTQNFVDKVFSSEIHIRFNFPSP